MGPNLDSHETETATVNKHSTQPQLLKLFSFKTLKGRVRFFFELGLRNLSIHQCVTYSRWWSAHTQFEEADMSTSAES